MAEPNEIEGQEPVVVPPQDPGDGGEPGEGGTPGAGNANDDRIIKLVQGVMAKALQPLIERTANVERHVTSFIERPSAGTPGGVRPPVSGDPSASGLEQALEGLDFLDNPKEAAKRILGIAEAIADARIQTQLAANRAESDFYEANPGLKGNEHIVQSIFQKVVKEKPTLQGTALAKELADESNREIARIKALNPTIQHLPPRVEPGGGTNPPPAPGAPKPTTQEEEVDEHIKMRRKAKNKLPKYAS